MQKLSSELTPITKYVLPGVVASLLILALALSDLEKPTDYLPLFILGPVVLFLFWWAAPIKKVELTDHQFIISNYFNQISVPTAHLRKITEDRGNRTRNITLFFEPATSFGRKIRIVTPQGITSRNHNNAASLLRIILNENNATEISLRADHS